MSITAQEMVERLKGVPEGAELFVSYLAGRVPTDRAIREAGKADEMGVSRRWLQGRLERVWVTKRGQPVMTMFCFTRRNEQDPDAEGHYRTVNPALGQLLSLEVIQ